MDLDSLVSDASQSVFSGLKTDDRRIIKILAKEGNLNLKEIGERTKKYAYSFDRWGALKRLRGSSKSLGLIPNDYVYSIKINKKETQYGLKLKGVLAALAEINFEEIKAVQNYKKLTNVWIWDDKIVEWIAAYIKLEISLILVNNYYKGFGWTRFKFVDAYWDQFKLYDENFFRNFILDVKKLKPDLRRSYEEIISEYLTYFFLLNEAIHPVDFTFFKEEYPEGSFDDRVLRTYIDRWDVFIDKYNMEDFTNKFDLSRKDNIVSPIDDKAIRKHIFPATRKAYKIFRKSKTYS